MSAKDDAIVATVGRGRVVRSHGLRLFATALLLAACTVAPSPSTSGRCGPLTQDDCQAAIAVAETALLAQEQPFTSIRIEAPTALMTCPPSGGLFGSHLCQVVAIASTTHGDVAVGLVRSTTGWIWSAEIR